MPIDNPVTTNDANRRENFRIDDLLATSVQKITASVPPVARMIPVTLATSGALGADTRYFPHELDHSFAMLLLETNAKLDLLFEFYKLPDCHEEQDLKPSMTQLLLAANAKLDNLLDFHRIARKQTATRVGEVNLSASGIKLTSLETFAAGDLVEVHLLLGAGQPYWLVIGGSVVRTKPTSEDASQVSIQFTTINTSIQEAISTYALKKQKEQLINKRGL